jgi:hypothetical protein
VTLYGYARDPSAPEPEPSSANVPQPRSAPDDLWEDLGPLGSYGSYGSTSGSPVGSSEGNGFSFPEPDSSFAAPDAFAHGSIAAPDAFTASFSESSSYGTGSNDFGSFAAGSSAGSFEPPAFDSFEPPSYQPLSHEPPAFEAPSYEPPAFEPPAFEPASLEPRSFGISSGSDPLGSDPLGSVPFGTASRGSGSYASASSADVDPLGDLTPEPLAAKEPPAWNEPPAWQEPPVAEPAPATVTARVSVPVITSRPPAPDPVPVQSEPSPVSAVPASTGAGTDPGGEDDAAARAAAIAWVEQNVESDGPDIQPWDRRPLLIVLAAAAALVLVAVISGVASANLFRPDIAWQAPRGTGTTPPTPGATPGAAAPPVSSDTITLSGVGDVIMGTEYRGGGGKLPPNNGQGFFDPVKAALASDLVMGNLETPLTVDTGAGKCAADATDCFQFFLPPAYANYMRDGGFQVLNLANNHSRDMGTAGLANTRTSLEDAGIKPTGAPGEITIVNVKGFKVAVLGFSVYSWGNNLNNLTSAVNLVKSAASQADLVVIQMQGGAEGADKSHVVPGHEFFAGEDRGDLIAFSHAVIDAGADVIFGHGPHIMRGMEFYKGRLIAYSLGNFCGYGTLNSAGFLGVGGVLRVTLNRDGTWANGKLVSTQLVRGGMVDVDPNNRALAFVQGLSNTDFGPRAARISPTDGVIAPPAAA